MLYTVLVVGLLANGEVSTASPSPILWCDPPLSGSTVLMGGGCEVLSTVIMIHHLSLFIYRLGAERDGCGFYAGPYPL